MPCEAPNLTTICWAVRLPRGRTYERSCMTNQDQMLEIVDVADTPSITINAAGRTNDPWPFHADPEAAARSPFGGLIASGGYTITLMYRLGHEIVNQPDRAWAFLGGFDWHVKFVEPVRSGDRLHERITILEKRTSSKPGRGIVKHLIEVINDREHVVLSIEKR